MNLAAAEEQLAERENANLLYVAMTRAKQALIVSGVSGAGPQASWHARLRAAAQQLADTGDTQDAVVYGADLEAAEKISVGPQAAAHTTSAPAEALRCPLPTGERRVPATGRGGL